MKYILAFLILVGVAFDQTVTVGKSGCTYDINGNVACNPLGGVVQISADMTGTIAGSQKLGTALLPFGDVFIGPSASHALDFNVASLTTNRQIIWPDNAGIIGELNLAQSWTAKQTFTGAGTAAGALNIPSQTTPTTPVAGDIWHDTNGINLIDATGIRTQVSIFDSGQVNAVQLGANGTVTAYSLDVPGAAPGQNHSGMDCTTVGACVYAANGQTAAVTTVYTNSTTTVSNITGLSFAVDANKTYTGWCELSYQAASTSGGLVLQMTGPASPTAFLMTVRTFTTATADRSDIVTALSTSITGAVVGTATTNFGSHVTFHLRNGANAGTLQLKAASKAAVQLTIQVDSMCWMQ